MNFGFWNINDKKLDSLIKQFADEFELDILILGESPYSPDELLLLLNSVSSDYYYAPGILCEKIQIFTKFKDNLITPIEESKRITARKLYSPKYGDVTLIAAHYNSKVNWSNEDQAAHAPTFKYLIDSVENKIGHKRTVVCGDFNMNPFDFGMVQSTGLHAVMDRKIAQKKSRTVDGIEYDFFYNPMWGFLGDNGKGNVSGSMYYSPAKPINFHWNLFDQVIIRHEIANDLIDEELKIITKLGDTNLLTENEQVSSRYSDHLPLKFQINI
ncbi:MAG TPA: hypothetical protein PKC69_13455 [Chitinophagaceae bacterium]|nr:hypothetical protein [Chitinophagaceae bacterium]